ncbi:Unknown protein, partial [Striga hermonthica]
GIRPLSSSNLFSPQPFSFLQSLSLSLFLSFSIAAVAHRSWPSQRRPRPSPPSLSVASHVPPFSAGPVRVVSAVVDPFPIVFKSPVPPLPIAVASDPVDDHPHQASRALPTPGQH